MQTLINQNRIALIFRNSARVVSMLFVILFSFFYISFFSLECETFLFFLLFSFLFLKNSPVLGDNNKKFIFSIKDVTSNHNNPFIFVSGETTTT